MAHVTEAQVVQSIHKRASLILEEQRRLSLRGVRRLLEDDLGVAGGVLDSFKAVIAAEVDTILQYQASEVPRARAIAEQLPVEVAGQVLAHLGHDSLFQAAAVCRVWRDAAADESVWQAQCLRHGWKLPAQPQPSSAAGAAPRPGGSRQQGRAAPAARCSKDSAHPPQPPAGPRHGVVRGRTRLNTKVQEQQLGGKEKEEPGGPLPAAQQQERQHWRQLYREQYRHSCFECFQRCSRTTLGFAPLVLRFCADCRKDHAASRPEHRLVSKTEAKSRYCLRDADLAGLPHALDANPVDPGFAPMQLFRRVDVAGAAVARWGSLAAAAEEHRRRIAR